MPGIVDPLDWERGQRDAKVRELEARIEAATDPEERRDLQRQLREARSDFTRKTIRQRLRDVFLPW